MKKQTSVFILTMFTYNFFICMFCLSKPLVNDISINRLFQRNEEELIVFMIFNSKKI